MKKLIFGLGTFALVVTPIVATVSCGNIANDTNPSKAKPEASSQIDDYFGARRMIDSEEVRFYKGKDIHINFVSDIDAIYKNGNSLKVYYKDGTEGSYDSFVENPGFVEVKANSYSDFYRRLGDRDIFINQNNLKDISYRNTSLSWGVGATSIGYHGVEINFLDKKSILIKGWKAPSSLKPYTKEYWNNWNFIKEWNLYDSESFVVNLSTNKDGETEASKGKMEKQMTEDYMKFIQLFNENLFKERHSSQAEYEIEHPILPSEGTTITMIHDDEDETKPLREMKTADQVMDYFFSDED